MLVVEINIWIKLYLVSVAIRNAEIIVEPQKM